MGDGLPGNLEGLSVRKQDTADSHRWNAYYRFFGLEPDEDRPLAFQWLLFSELPREIRDDGHPARMEPFPEMPYPRRMWAGGEVAWSEWLAPGLQVSRTTTITRAGLKSGATGEFLLASLQHELQVDGRTYVKERQDVVFLPAETRPGEAPPREPPFEPEWRVPRRFDSVALFQYSALTLNAHRIHYDAAYAKTAEGYPALVVHGPLLASDLMQQASRQRPQRVPERFTYRAVAPTFVDSGLELTGRSEDDREELAIVGNDGGLRMTATMHFAPGI